MEKCDGRLVIENKKKKLMIEELVKSGYDSDPLKAWKLQIDKESALVSLKFYFFFTEKENCSLLFSMV